MLKASDANTRKRCAICSNLTIKTSGQHHGRHSGAFIINFEYISHLLLVFVLWTFIRATFVELSEEKSRNLPSFISVKQVK